MFTQNEWAEVAEWGDVLTNTYNLPVGFKFGPQIKGRHLICSIETNGRKFLFKAVAGGDGRFARLQGELEFQHYLNQHGALASCPVMCDDKSGQFVVEHPTGALGALYGYLPGRPCKATTEDAYAIGKSLAQLHILGDDFETTACIPVGNRSLLIDRPGYMVKNMLGQNLSPYILTLMSELGDWLNKLPCDEGEFGLCHGDSHYENALISDDQVVSYCDFEYLMRSWRAYDLATFIWGTFRLTKGADVWNSFIQGYTSIRSLSERESNWIRPFLVIRQIWWIGFNIESAPQRTLSLQQLIEDEVAFIKRLADEIDVHAILAKSEEYL